VKLFSWNVNGIRAITRKGFLEWVHDTDPDILCLQETKAHPDQLTMEILSPRGYSTFWSSAVRKGYSGVAIYTKTEPVHIEEGLGIREFDDEGRTLIAEYDSFFLFNVYVPNGQDGNKRVPFKLSFCEALQEKADEKRSHGKPVITCGDFNTAHTEIDLARPKENSGNTGFLPEERAWIDRFLAAGYIDTFREFNHDPENYSWWDYKTFARKRNVGWRLDYFFISEEGRSALSGADIHADVMGSDHCPVSIEID